MSERVTAVVVEWSTDYIAILADGVPELVSIKHRDPGQGEWPMSELAKVVRDLHMVWRAQNELCCCAFASNAAITPDAARKIDHQLGEYLSAGTAEVERFRQVLTMPGSPLPRRSEITAVGVRDMAGALSLLDRDPRFAEECYTVLVDRIATVATEQPDSPEQRIARLTGSLRAVEARRRPDLSEQTLQIAGLRELILRTHADLVQRPPRTYRAPATVRRSGNTSDEAEWRGGHEVRVGTGTYLIHDPVEARRAPDHSFREQRARARQLTPRQRDVRIVRLDIARPGHAADQRRAQLIAEADLHGRAPGLPPVVARGGDGRSCTFAVELPTGTELPAAFGPPPYPATALDALLRALPTAARPLAGLHAAGLAHRALRPESFVLTGDRVRLCDAGLATVPPAVGEGWPDYRAPEQERPILGRPGPETDVYQLTAIVYHLAVGQPPGTDPPPPSLLRPGLSAALDAALTAGLAPEPGDRPGLRALMSLFAEVLQSGGASTC